jgi:putative acetyltransferase
MIVRREGPDDHSSVAAVHSAAFGARPGERSTEARLVEDLRADGAAVPELSLVAVDGEDVVGHVMCSRGSLDGTPLLGLGPLGVLPSHQRRGVGQALMHGVLAAADALGEPAVVLLGDPGYYCRFGFVPSAPLGVLPPQPGWAKHFQVRRLSSWDDATRGTFRFAAAFDGL